MLIFTEIILLRHGLEKHSQSSVKRESIQIISKCGIQYVGNTRDNRIKHYNYSKDYILWSVEKSLLDLQTDYLDLLLLHRPSPLMRKDEIEESISQLKKEGKVMRLESLTLLPLRWI